MDGRIEIELESQGNDGWGGDGQTPRCFRPCMTQRQQWLLYPPLPSALAVSPSVLHHLVGNVAFIHKTAEVLVKFGFGFQIRRPYFIRHK